MSANLCPCTHPATDHSTLAGCLAPGCDCEAAPVFQDAAPSQGLQEGRKRRDEGMEAAGSTAPGALVTAWRAEAATALDVLALSGQEFSADDLVDMIGAPPRPNMLGGLFMGASKRNLIQPVGFTQGKRATAHARIQRTWKGA